MKLRSGKTGKGKGFASPPPSAARAHPLKTLIQAAGTDPIQAAGKKLSSSNVERLQAGVKNLGSVIEVLNVMLEEAGAEVVVVAGENGPRIDAARLPQIDPTRLEAGALEERVERSSWYDRFYTIMRIFSYYYEETVWAYYEELTVAETKAKIAEMVEDFGTLMMALYDSYLQTFTEESGSTVSAAAAPPKESQLIQLSMGEFSLSEITGGNTIPIDGILATLDAPSEGVPAIGPGMKLMIPSAVAAAALQRIPGLPLDADPSLVKHNNQGIVGVMLGGSIQGSNMCIRGHLFPFNVPEMVTSIRANQKKLGMSMNANAPGHVEVINGENVYVVDELILLGANILEAEKATYKQTRIAATADVKPADRRFVQEYQPIAAGADPNLTPNSTEETDMTPTEVQKIVDDSNAAVLTQLGAVATQLENVSKVVNLMAEERNQRIEADQVAASAAAEAQKTKELQAMVVDTTFSAVTQLMNPSGTPARMTTPVSAGGGGTNQITPIDVQIGNLEGQLTTLVQAGHSSGAMQRRLGIKDQIRALQHMKAQGITDPSQVPQLQSAPAFAGF